MYFAVEPDAALLVQDDEADGGNVVGVCIGWARLLRTHLFFPGYFSQFWGVLKSEPILELEIPRLSASAGWPLPYLPSV